MPKNSSRTAGRVSDITAATVTELTRLPAEVFQLHLSSRHLVTSGNNATLACRLHEALHPVAPATTALASTTLHVTATPPSTSASSNNTTIPPSTSASSNSFYNLQAIYLQTICSTFPTCHQPCRPSFPPLSSSSFTMPPIQQHKAVHKLMYHQRRTAVSPTPYQLAQTFLPRLHIPTSCNLSVQLPPSLPSCRTSQPNPLAPISELAIQGWSPPPHINCPQQCCLAKPLPPCH